MSVLDAQPVVALLLGEPGARAVASVLRDPEDRPSISSANVAEIVDVLIRGAGQRGDDVLEKIDWLVAGGLRILPLDDETARLTGHLRATYYDRRARPVSLGDCFALATAIRLDEALVTADPVLVGIARAEGCTVIGVPDSQGRLPD